MPAGCWCSTMPSDNGRAQGLRASARAPMPRSGRMEEKLTHQTQEKWRAQAVKPPAVICIRKTTCCGRCFQAPRNPARPTLSRTPRQRTPADRRSLAARQLPSFCRVRARCRGCLSSRRRGLLALAAKNLDGLAVCFCFSRSRFSENQDFEISCLDKLGIWLF